MRVAKPIIFDAGSGAVGDFIPAGPGVYALRVSDKPAHVSWSANLHRRVKRLAGLALGGNARIECWPTGSRLENLLLLYELVRAEYPDDYLRRLRLRSPWFVGLTATDSFARLTTVNRTWLKDGPLFGPFQSRDRAQLYEQEILPLFQLRRCTETLAPHPEHPGCIYGEMNQCLRPCQMAVTAEEYATETARVADFLATNGKGTMAALAAARERACDEMDFEQAAEIHKQVERVSATASLRDEIVTEARAFNGVALTRGLSFAGGAGARQMRLWPMFEGIWQEPATLDFSLEEPRARSLDSELRERLGEALRTITRTGSRTEQLALFSRWYFSTWRDGQWFPFRTLADLNYRKLVRGISNMAKDETVHSC